MYFLMQCIYIPLANTNVMIIHKQPKFRVHAMYCVSVCYLINNSVLINKFYNIINSDFKIQLFRTLILSFSSTF